MAQGAKKFTAQRPGMSKKQHNSKQKGPKKGGTGVVELYWCSRFGDKGKALVELRKHVNVRVPEVSLNPF